MAKLDEIAERISAHLKRFEADPAINLKNKENGTSRYWRVMAHRAGNRVGVCYVAYQGTTNLTKSAAEQYLAWLDAGNVGKHFQFK